MIGKFTRAACYVRVSTENQLENYSVEEQTERLKAYCTAKDWNIHKIYTDGGYSGGNRQRPALQQMLCDIHSNKLDMVVVYKLDRLSRSQKDTLTLIEDEFLSNNVEFVSMSENFDTSTPFGRAMIGVLSVFAQLEKDQITERFTMGRIGRGKAGYYHGGPFIPTGYNYVDGKLVVDEYKAIQVREVFDKFLSGHSINSIWRRMHAEYGGWNSHTNVVRILRNNVYIGKVKFNKQTYDGVHDPIISQEAFEQTQNLLNSGEREQRKAAPQKSPFRAGYLLISLIYCGKCGAKYSAVQGRYKCYSRSKCDRKYIVDGTCKNKNWEIETLDNIIINEIGKLREDRGYVDRILGEKKEEPGVNKKLLNERIKAIDNQISRLIDLYQVKDVPVEQISSRMNTLRKEKDVLSEKVLSPIEMGAGIKRKFISHPINFADVFKGDSLEEKRLFASSIIKSIIIDDEQVSINWRI